MNPTQLLTKAEQQQIQDKIKQLEESAHCKIVIHVIPDHAGDLYQVALSEFSKQQLHHTKIKTGILLLISLKKHQFQLLGDQHIHEKIGDEGWKTLASQLSNEFKEGRYFEGITSLLNELTQHLLKHFGKGIS